MLRIGGALALAGIVVAGAFPAEAPCVRPSKPGTQVQGEVKICPGRYRIADPTERGVIVVAGSGTRLMHGCRACSRTAGARATSGGSPTSMARRHAILAPA